MTPPANRFADDLLALRALPRPAALMKTAGAARGLPLEVWETADAYTVVAEIPGLDPALLETTFHDNTLTLKGERPRPEHEGELRLGELTYGPFERTTRFATPVASEEIRAESKHGVLTVRLPKVEEAKPRKIEIQLAE